MQNSAVDNIAKEVQMNKSANSAVQCSDQCSEAQLTLAPKRFVSQFYSWDTEAGLQCTECGSTKEGCTVRSEQCEEQSVEVGR